MNLSVGQVCNLPLPGRLQTCPTVPGTPSMIRLTTDPIDHAALTEAVRRKDCGAVVTFLGTVRDLTEGRITVALDYEAYPAMAEKKMAEIERAARERWPVGEMALVHRLGRLDVGEISVVVSVSC